MKDTEQNAAPQEGADFPSYTRREWEEIYRIMEHIEADFADRGAGEGAFTDKACELNVLPCGIGGRLNETEPIDRFLLDLRMDAFKVLYGNEEYKDWIKPE